MEISYQWLLRFLPGLPAAELVGEKLTACGLEVESVTPVLSVPGGLEGVVTGFVRSAEKHPDADKLSICQVDTGAEAESQIVCGAPNVAAGQTVLVALPGATLYPAEGEPFKIKKSKIRGAESNGMICAADELGLGSDHSGIMVLDTAFAPGTPAAEALNLQPDYIFSIGLTPNRADAASHFGVARDLRALFGEMPVFPDSAFDRSQMLAQNPAPAVSIEALEACGIYALQRIEGLEVKPAPEDMQKLLRNAGLNPMNVVVDITNYMLMGYGQPMHAFDADKIQGNISVRFARRGETLITLSGAELKLQEDDLIIADASGPVALAGVIGGKESAVSAETQNILLETAWFHPDAVRKTARNHQINTDASFRFARGTDPESVLKFQEIALGVYAGICGGKICGAASVAQTEIPAGAEITFSLKDFYRLSGIQIPEAEVIQILESLEIQVQAQAEKVYALKVPAYRVDVRRPQDVYEDILRIYGYERVPVSGNMPSAPVFPLADREVAVRHLLADQLAAKGYYEILTNSLVSRAAAGEAGVQMKNPLSEEHAAMRSTLLDSGLEVMAYNKNRKAADLRFFEFGKIYHPSDTGFQETLQLAVWLGGERSPDHWRGKSAEADLFTLTALVEWIQSGLQQKISREESADPDFEYGFILKAGKEILGRYGLVSQSKRDKADVNAAVYYLELDWKRLFKAVGKKVQDYQELPKFPSVRRDLSLVIPEGVSWDQVRSSIQSADPGLIRAVDLFDIYTSSAEQGKKTSYSVSVTLSDPGNTLQEARIEKTLEKILNRVKDQTGAVLRDN